MRMKHVAGILLVLSAFVVDKARGGEPSFELTAVGTIEVAPDGSVHAYDLETKLGSDVETLVERTVRTWRFEPVLVDGRAVIAKTRMRLELVAEPVDDGYALRVDDVFFGSVDARNNTPPTFPTTPLREGVGARVILVLQLDATGKVAQIHVEQVSLTKNAGWRAKALQAHFIAASRRAAATWTYNIEEFVDGEPAPTTLVRVPIEYSLRESGGWTERQAYVPGPIHPMPWADTDEGITQEQLDGLAQGDAQPLGSRVRLKDDVVGSVL